MMGEICTICHEPIDYDELNYVHVICLVKIEQENKRLKAELKAARPATMIACSVCHCGVRPHDTDEQGRCPKCKRIAELEAALMETKEFSETIMDEPEATEILKILQKVNIE